MLYLLFKADGFSETGSGPVRPLKALLAAAFLAAVAHAGLFLLPLGDRTSRTPDPHRRQVMIDLVEPVPPRVPSPPRRIPVSENKPRLQPPAPTPAVRTAPSPPVAAPPAVAVPPIPAAPAADPHGFSLPAQPTPSSARVEGKAAAGPPNLPAKPGRGDEVSEAVPLYRDNPPPLYPALARKRGYEGTVILEVLVSRKGRVEDQKIHQSSGYGLLDEAALTTVKDWQFNPGKKGETPVDMWVRVPIRFNLKNK